MPLALRPCVSALALALLTITGAAGARPAAPAAGPAAGPQVVRCVDFLPLPDNTALMESFKRSGFKFRDKAGVFAPFVNDFTDLAGQLVHGMQFDTRSLRISPPQPAYTVTLRIGGFSAPDLSITAYDVSGAIQDGAAVASDNLMHTVALTANTDLIAWIEIIGGGNEGVVNWVCASAP